MENSGFGRVLSVFWSPGATFRSIAERPTWLPPLLVFLVVVAAFTFVVHQHTDYYETTQWNLQQRDQDMPAEDLERVADMQEKFGAIGALVAMPVVVVVLLIVTVITWVLLKLFGGELSFKQAFAVQAHSALPGAIMMLLSILILLPKGDLTPQEVTSRNFLMSNLGFLAPEGASLAMERLLASVDFFGLWSVVLAIIGFRITARVSTGAATAVVGLVWLAGVALQVGMAALMGGGFGG